MISSHDSAHRDFENANFRNSSQAQQDVDGHRAHPRVAAEVPVALFSEHNFYSGLTENISEGGVFIATYQTLPVGTELELTIVLYETTRIKVVGEVRWIREHNELSPETLPGIGVQFVSLPQTARVAIEQFIEGRSTMLYDA